MDRGYTDYVHLKDGTLDLVDIAIMNDVIDIKDENERRAIAARNKD